MGNVARALVACGILPGESFQLASILDRVIHCATFTSPRRAKAWADAESSQGRNIYLCGNPVRGDLGAARAKATDVTRTACLLVDVDPDGGADGDPLRVARELAGLLGSLGGGPWPVVDSGRGAQVWVQVDESVDRRALLRWLATKAGPGVKLDATQDPARLMRLPGYVNQRTGRRACLTGT